MRPWQIGPTFGHLQRSDAPVPTPGPGELLLKMSAVALNYRDLLMLNGAYNPRQPLPLTPCSDGVGVVVASGPGTTTASGARVLPIFAQGWLDGTPDRSMLSTTLGGPLSGTLTPYLVVRESAVVAAPAHLTDAEASTLGCAAVTAWRALVTLGGLAAGDVVLTQGTGGVSLFALQVAKMHGASVILTSSSDDKLARAKALGADHGINYRADASWGRTALALTQDRGVDHVIELGGSATLDQSLRAVRPGGIIDLIGMLSGSSAEVLLTRIFMQGVRVQGVMVGSRADLAALCRALSANPGVRPTIDRVFGYDEAPEAFARLKSGEHFGKIVVSLDGA